MNKKTRETRFPRPKDKGTGWIIDPQFLFEMVHKIREEDEWDVDLEGLEAALLRGEAYLAELDSLDQT